MIVGVTGGIGSGKSTVVQFFESFKNVAVYIADIEAKKLMHTSANIQQKIKENFGNEAYLNGSLHRKYLADIVFKNKEKLSILNDIIHPEVKKDFLNFSLQQKDKAYVIYESALLFETQSNTNFDKIICVSAPLEIRINRVVNRDKVTREEVLRRISNQMSQEKKILQSHYHIENISLNTTKIQVDRIHNFLTEKTA
jgi:dephospho-CoA kinase